MYNLCEYGICTPTSTSYTMDITSINVVSPKPPISIISSHTLKSHHKTPSSTEPSHLVAPIPLIRMRLKLILIPIHNRRRAPHPLQLTRNIIMQMLIAIPILRQCQATILPTERSTAIVLV